MPMRTRGDLVEAVQAAMHNWAGAVESLDVDAVLRCYHPTYPVLWGTVAGVRRDSIDEVRTYFDRFLDRQRIGVTFQPPYIRVFGTLAISTGDYAFQLADADGESTIQARYSFVFEKVGDDWLIVDHHSSAMPDDGI